ncbi:MAG: hypothetical protein HQ483_01750 [Rhodospirillales bacterium]|nr:hypothetical protein [Rhodospirillales bacterium]
MNRVAKYLTLIVATLSLSVSLPAGAALTALISVHEGSRDMWEQRDRIQTLLRQRFGFDEVHFLVDATPAEVPARLKQFLEEAAEPDDRRLVWLSGFADNQETSICAARSFDTIRPRASSLILAPACYTDIITLPQGTRHYGLTAPLPGNSTARLGRTRAADAPWIAVLTLPSTNDAIIHGTNALIFAHLEEAPVDHLDPAALLHHLRVKFRWNGSDFTPTLDLFDRGLDPGALAPFGIRPTAAGPLAAIGGAPGLMRRSSFGLYAKPDALDGLEMSAHIDDPVRVLRRDRSGQMRFVAVGTDFFGWVRTDDLAE